MSTLRPKISAARAEATAAVSVRFCSRMSRALPAVSYVATISTFDRLRRNDSHCASACGCEHTRRIWEISVPGSATR